MCGIGGIVGGRPDPAHVSALAEAMAHRGPDGQATWTSDGVAFAFRRLAIIDLNPRSDQPLHHDHLHLVFNGEIYNYLELRDELRSVGHRFVTEGDGEVLLHAWAEWGESALDRLNGMFAFAVWDDRDGSLTVATDPFGEKPLYWIATGERLAFASDIRALMQVEGAVGAANEKALAPFVALGMLPPIDQSFFAGISRLPGAHVLRWRGGQYETARWWWPSEIPTPATYEDAVERLRELLLGSIRLRLRSDVPVGTSLSGGIDSSAVVALSAELTGDHRRHAFTASFAGFERDETRFAAEVASAAGVMEHPLVRPTAPEWLADLDRLVMDQEEPFTSTSIYAQWRVMAAAREAGVTVLLDGQGADELFGGYDVTGGWALRSAGARAAALGLLRGPSRLARAKAMATELVPPVVARRYRRAIASPYASTEAIAQAIRIEPEPTEASSPLRRNLLREAFHTSLPGLLRFADRDSMAHSCEVRLPFLDRRLAEFALSLPPDYLYRHDTTKQVLRDAVRGAVPDAVLARRDKGRFETPEERWFAEPAFLERALGVFTDPSVKGSGLYDVGAITRDARDGSWRSTPALWRALNVELWRSAITSVPRPRIAMAAP
jgi:asparagine synthase (glutamine-hydrolysing)